MCERTMRAAWLDAPRKLELREQPIPAPGPGELLLKVRAALTCGTDLKTWRRGHPKMPLPTRLGHEFSGEVAAVGRGLTRFREGDQLMGVHTAPCGDCERCHQGRANLCPEAMREMVLGGFADYLLLPARVVRVNAFAKPAELPWEQAALLEPLSCVSQGLDRIGLHAGERVLLIGAGAIGLMQLLLARQRGAEVVVYGRRKQRLELARRLGASHVVDAAQQDAEEQLRASLGPRRADVVIECAGTPDAWELACSMTRPGGRVLLFAGCAPGTRFTLDTTRVHYEELLITGSFHFTPQVVAKTRELLLDGSLELGALVQEQAPLGEVVEVFERLDRGRHLKVALQP